ncbi:hypothetical protein BMS3Abin15_00117 [bacterium BMS3Abin15]|nr:hypothetical protein BMS3Abin15_00117 [bacterium BMS3Abin15]
MGTFVACYSYAAVRILIIRVCLFVKAFVYYLRFNCKVDIIKYFVFRRGRVALLKLNINYHARHRYAQALQAGKTQTN